MLNRIWERKIPFFAVFFITVLVSYAFLTIIDFIPEPITDEQSATQTVDTSTDETSVSKTDTEFQQFVEVEDSTPPVDDVLPLKIIFDELDREVTVLNPQSREIADLDAALLSGAVRHPDSANFSEAGNIFILGHSSYLPNVFNKNFQAFNGIQELKWGNTIRLQSKNMEYVYSVEKVFQAPASEITVPFTSGKAKLTLATCNSFGSKDDRFVVEAKLISSRAL